MKECDQRAMWRRGQVGAQTAGNNPFRDES